QKSIHFADMEGASDPTLQHDGLVVTVDAQLFYSVLSALPYLLRDPHECVEQTLNRFLSAGIVSGIYKGYPAVARMALQLSKRKTELEGFTGEDPNRR